MAEPDANTPQVIDPERVVDLTRLLQIRGPLGVLNVLDTIVPVVNMGDVVTRTVRVEPAAFRSSDVFSNGVLFTPATNAILADTGPLAEGIYDIILSGSSTGSANAGHAFSVEHRNAANAANLAIWSYLMNTAAGDAITFPTVHFAYEFALNERLRVFNVIAFAAGETASVVVFARRRT